MTQPILLGKVGCSVSFRGIPPDLDSYVFTPKSLPSTPPTCHSLFMRGNRREFPFSQRLREKATLAHVSDDEKCRWGSLTCPYGVSARSTGPCHPGKQHRRGRGARSDRHDDRQDHAVDVRLSLGRHPEDLRLGLAPLRELVPDQPTCGATRVENGS